MRYVSKSQLKAKMLEIFRELEKSGGELIVTDNRKPVLKIAPLKEKKSREDVFGKYQGKVQYFENILKPTIDEWEET